MSIAFDLPKELVQKYIDLQRARMAQLDKCGGINQSNLPVYIPPAYRFVCKDEACKGTDEEIRICREYDEMCRLGVVELRRGITKQQCGIWDMVLPCEYDFFVRNGLTPSYVQNHLCSAPKYERN